MSGPLLEAKGNLIGGAWQPAHAASGRIVSTCPAAPEQVYWQQDVAVAAVDEAVAAARQAFSGWRRQSLDARAGYLQKLKERIHAEAAALAEAIAHEAGKPLWEARTEVAALENKIDITLSDGLKDIEPRTLPDGSGRISHHAHGVMAVLGPFNFPLSLSHGHIVPSLLAGNSVVLKPSEQTPGVAQRYAELFLQAGFPPGVFNLVQGAGDVGQSLAVHPGVDGVLFTGSYGVGRALLQATLDQPHKILALEMGGKNASVVFADADLKLTLYELVFSAFVTCGQRCTATSRLILCGDDAFADAFTGELARVVAGLRVGDPFANDTFMGPLISARAKDGFLRAAHGLAAAAKVVFSGSALPQAGHFVAPQVLLAPPDHALPLFREELFGPSLVVYRAKDEAAAMALANDTPYGLALSVFTADEARFGRVLNDSRAGIVNWNKGTVGATGRLPFGGIGKSGNFRPAGSFSTRYATYPVATVTGGKLPALPPGFPAP